MIYVFYLYQDRIPLVIINSLNAPKALLSGAEYCCFRKGEKVASMQFVKKWQKYQVFFLFATKIV